MRDFDESNRYFVQQHWRNIPESKVEAMDDFLSWLGNDSSSPDISQETMGDIKALVDEYLGRNNMEKVKQGEQELLQAWIKAIE